MTAFADRTVVTIAVSGTLTGCRGYPDLGAWGCQQERTSGRKEPAGLAQGRTITLPLFSSSIEVSLSQGPVSHRK